MGDLIAFPDSTIPEPATCHCKCQAPAAAVQVTVETATVQVSPGASIDVVLKALSGAASKVFRR